MNSLFDFFLILIGGGLGAVSRYALGSLFSDRLKSIFPIGTFFVNILGAYLLGVFTSYNASNDIKLLLADGFLGAFTTFSAFMLESEVLLNTRRWNSSLIYILITLFLGITAFFCGTHGFAIWLIIGYNY